MFEDDLPRSCSFSFGSFRFICLSLKSRCLLLHLFLGLFSLFSCFLGRFLYYIVKLLEICSGLSLPLFFSLLFGLLSLQLNLFLLFFFLLWGLILLFLLDCLLLDLLLFYLPFLERGFTVAFIFFKFLRSILSFLDSLLIFHYLWCLASALIIY